MAVAAALDAALDVAAVESYQNVAVLTMLLLLVD